MKPLFYILGLVLFLSFASNDISLNEDYTNYHAEVYQAEELLAQESFSEALHIYRRLVDNYDFVFVRDYKIATQIAWYLGFKDEAFAYLRLGIVGGWEMNSIKSNKFLKELRKSEEWSVIKGEYDSLRNVFNQNINQELRTEVRAMSLKDQRKGLESVLRIGSKSQDKFGETKFAPLNEKHLRRLMVIIDSIGFPGERLVSFEPWGQGIVSRHNSISKAYCEADTLYPFLKPILLSCIKKGNLSPASFAWIDEWYITVKSGWLKGSYGYVKALKKEDVANSNTLRTQIGLRKIETRNKLIDLQNKNQMDFYLPVQPKKDGKILTN